MTTSAVTDHRDRIAAPRTTAALTVLLLVGILTQAVTAGAFLGGHHAWYVGHEAVGSLLILLPIAALVIGIVSRIHRTERAGMLVLRAALLLLSLIVMAAGHAGRAWLPLHIPAAVCLLAAAVAQLMLIIRTTPGDR